jgi:hypothetical protein
VAQFLKQSTAFTFRIGPFVDSTDGVTAETALSIAQADIQISKAGGAFAQTSASPTTTHDADGWYQCPLTTTDTGTLGMPPKTAPVAASEPSALASASSAPAASAMPPKTGDKPDAAEMDSFRFCGQRARPRKKISYVPCPRYI